MAKTIEETIASLEQKLKQAKALKQKQEARQRAIDAKLKRTADTRRKVLLGAFLLEHMERAGKNPLAFSFEGKRFEPWLTRDDDRILFGAQPLPAQSPGSPTEPGATTSAGTAPSGQGLKE